MCYVVIRSQSQCGSKDDIVSNETLSHQDAEVHASPIKVYTALCIYMYVCVCAYIICGGNRMDKFTILGIVKILIYIYIK